MRRYDEIIDVRKGLVRGDEAPEQFVWRSRLWVVRTVLSYWVETGAWWEQAGVSALFGEDAAPGSAAVAELLEESEVWRVEAARNRLAGGVFDLVFSWEAASWRLRYSLD